MTVNDSSGVTSLVVAIGFASDSVYALGSAAIGRWLHRRPALARRQHHLTGAL